jgi:hypothetical protein
VFSDPQCEPCDALAPRLEALHRASTDPAVVMVSRRDMEDNRKKAAELGLTFPVVVQKGWEVSKKYGMFATPIGFLIGSGGVLESDVATGADAVLALAGAVPEPALATT